jgi:Ca-activated chloride channel family protein
VDVDEDALQKIADETGAKFYRATDTDSLKQIYANIDQLEKTTHTMKRFESQRELFGWAIIPALAVLGMSVGLEQTRFRQLPA